jgi:hypothetical protein
MVRKNTRRKSQKGGAWYNPTSWFQPSDPYAPKRSWGDYLSGTTNNIENSLSNLSTNIVDKTKSLGNSISSSISPSSETSVQPTPVQTQQPVETIQEQNQLQPMTAGRRRKMSQKMRGGKNGLGLSYYATPVSGIKVVEPTYWIYGSKNNMKAGSKKRNHKMHKKSRSCKKR